MATILDEKGQELALATLRAADGPDLTIERVIRGKGRLLQHYFGKGRRIVHVEDGDFFLSGTIATRWLGSERLWFIKLAQPGAPVLVPHRRRLAQWRPAS